jgi:bifunctional non-homologous end joining protein LigD
MEGVYHAVQFDANDLLRVGILADGVASGFHGPPTSELRNLQTDSVMRRRGPQYFYAFDVLWVEGEDLRGRPLLERKRLLRDLITAPGPALYVDHVAGSGVDLFDAACSADLEGIVAKRADGLYTPEETSWVKIKNRAYSQAEGRADFFAGRAYRAAVG